MTTGQILLAIITGLAANECCDVSPWAARKLVRWSARRRYAPPARAELRAEELAALIDDRPGKLFKLITALGFAAAAIVIRKVSLGVAPPTPTVSIHYEETDYLGHPNVRAMHRAWCQLADEVRNGARELGVGSRSWRRCIRKLRRITGDERWLLVARNLDFLLDEINSGVKSRLVGGGRAGGTILVTYRYSIPTDSTVTHYQADVETARADIRRLTGDFLLSSAFR